VLIYELAVAVALSLALSGGVAFADVTVSPTAPPDQSPYRTSSTGVATRER